MGTNSISIALAFVCYLSGMVYVGWRYMKRNESATDFFLGGRSVGPWMTALSAEASDMSGWLLMGLPGVAYLTGMKEAFWTALGLIIGTYLNWLIVAKPLRKYTIHTNNAITIPEFFTNRFKDSSRIISLVSVVFILIFFTIYTASGFVACAKLFNSVFNMPYLFALLLGIAIILAYTLLGGYMAVCATDFIQGSLMFVALVLTGVIMVFALGGPADAVAAMSRFGEQFLNPFVSGPEDSFGTMEIISALAWGLGYFGMPHILVRFMSLRSNSEVKLSRRIAMVWVIIAFAAALLVGAFGKAFLLPLVLGSGNADTVFIQAIIKIYPAFIAGIFLCAILAAAMSSADSQLLVAASAFSRDIFQGFLRRGANEEQTLRVSRWTVVAVAVIAFFIALDPNSSIFGLVSYAWAGFGATFGPLVLLALFWRGITRNGALAGLICGGITVLIWKPLSGGIFEIYEILPGFLMCLIAAVIVSLCDRNKNAEMLAEFDSYRNLAD